MGTVEDLKAAFARLWTELRWKVTRLETIGVQKAIVTEPLEGIRNSNVVSVHAEIWEWFGGLDVPEQRALMEGITDATAGLREQVIAAVGGVRMAFEAYLGGDVAQARAQDGASVLGRVPDAGAKTGGGTKGADGDGGSTDTGGTEREEALSGATGKHGGGVEPKQGGPAGVDHMPGAAERRRRAEHLTGWDADWFGRCRGKREDGEERPECPVLVDAMALAADLVRTAGAMAETTHVASRILCAVAAALKVQTEDFAVGTMRPTPAETALDEAARRLRKSAEGMRDARANRKSDDAFEYLESYLKNRVTEDEASVSGLCGALRNYFGWLAGQRPQVHDLLAAVGSISQNGSEVAQALFRLVEKRGKDLEGLVGEAVKDGRDIVDAGYADGLRKANGFLLHNTPAHIATGKYRIWPGAGEDASDA